MRSFALLPIVLAAATSLNALAQDKVLNIYPARHYQTDEALYEGFTKKTGIKVNFNEQPDQDAMLAQAKLSLQTGAVDFLEPTVERTQAFVENGIIQPWDMAKLDISSYEPGLVEGMAGDMATFDGKRYFVPAVWGTEALLFNNEQAPMEYGTASLGDLFDPKYAGAVTVRPHSALAAMGRFLDIGG